MHFCLLVRRILLVIFEFTVLFVLLDPVSSNSPFFHKYLLIYLIKLRCETCLLLSFAFFIPKYPFQFHSFLAHSFVVTISLPVFGPSCWGCRIHRMHICKGERPLNQCPEYHVKQSYGEVPVMLEPWGMQSNLLLPYRSSSTLSMGQILLNCVLMLNWIIWNKTVLTYNCV